ncbi:hypothetical protein Hanom_Chr04g00378051 [Helianthus anomalus]
MLSMNTSRFVVLISQSFRLFHLRIRSFPQFPHPLPFELIIQPFRHQFIIQILIIIINIIIFFVWIIFTVDQTTVVHNRIIINRSTTVIDFTSVFHFLFVITDFIYKRLHRYIRRRRSVRLSNKIIDIRRNFFVSDVIVGGGDVTVREVSVVGIGRINNLPRIGVGNVKVSVDRFEGFSGE